MKPAIKRTLLFIALAIFIFAPVVVVLLNWKLRDPIINVSVLLGFLGLALAGVQLLGIAKFHWLADALDMDKVYSSHHKVSLVAIFLVLAHPILLIVTNRVFWQYAELWAGWIGLAALILIGFTSAFRLNIKLDYVAWLWTHDILTAIIFIFGMWHMFSIDYYMDSPAVRWTWVTLIALLVLLIIYIRLLHPLAVASRPYKVESIDVEPNNVYTLNLVPDGNPGRTFRAGQIAWISTHKSPFIISRNPFSYSGSEVAADGCIRFSIKESGDFTSSIKHLEPGDRVFVDGPYGQFNLDKEETKKGLVMIGGGIGIAPVMSLVNTLADTGDQRPAYVFYGDLCEDTVLYSHEFERAEELANVTVTHVLEKPNREDCEFKGYITADVMVSVLPDNYKELFYFICGPAPMLRAMERVMDTMGIPSDRVHVENYDMA